MGLMPLESDYDRQKIVKLPEYRKKWMIVITDGIQLISKSKLKLGYFSKLRGKRIDFIDNNTNPKVNPEVLGPGIYSLVLHERFYYVEYYFYGKWDLEEDFYCACKLPGERCP